MVSQPQQLHDAIAKGIAHIEITAHLDLTTLPLQKNTGCEDGCDSALPDITLTKSIRVRVDSLRTSWRSAISLKERRRHLYPFLEVNWRQQDVEPKLCHRSLCFEFKGPMQTVSALNSKLKTSYSNPHERVASVDTTERGGAYQRCTHRLRAQLSKRNLV